MRATGLAAAATFAAFVAYPALAGQRPQTTLTLTTQWSQPVSPSVIGTFIKRGDLPFAILLWRGKPGWFLARPRGGSGGGSGDGTIRGTETFGPITVAFRFVGTTVEVQGISIDLSGGKNLLLIDNVDGREDQLKIDTIAVNLPPLAPRSVPSFSTMPEALGFLRCGEPLTDDGLKIWNRFVCDRAN